MSLTQTCLKKFSHGLKRAAWWHIHNTADKGFILCSGLFLTGFSERYVKHFLAIMPVRKQMALNAAFQSQQHLESPCLTVGGE